MGYQKLLKKRPIYFYNPAKPPKIPRAEIKKLMEDYLKAGNSIKVITPQVEMTK